jgi:hypothetical protein
MNLKVILRPRPPSLAPPSCRSASADIVSASTSAKSWAVHGHGNDLLTIPAVSSYTPPPAPTPSVQDTPQVQSIEQPNIPRHLSLAGTCPLTNCSPVDAIFSRAPTYTSRCSPNRYRRIRPAPPAFSHEAAAACVAEAPLHAFCGVWCPGTRDAGGVFLPAVLSAKGDDLAPGPFRALIRGAAGSTCTPLARNSVCPRRRRLGQRAHRSSSNSSQVRDQRPPATGSARYAWPSPC